MTTEQQCRLCGDRRGQERDGRLGRYRVTCDACDGRRGSHLVRTGNGYAGRTAEPLELSMAS